MNDDARGDAGELLPLPRSGASSFTLQSALGGPAEAATGLERMSPSAQSEIIALFLPSLRGGGAERVMLTLGATFAAEGRRVDLVLASATGPYLDRVPDTVRLVDLGTHRVLRSLPRLVAYLRRERPRALISAIGHTNIVALWSKQLARVATRTIVTEHGFSPRPPGQSGREYTLFPILMRCFYPAADSVVAVSHGLADDIAERVGLPRARIHVIYNPVVTPELTASAQMPVDHPWFAPGQPPVILSVGRLTAQKDYPTLIRAFERIAPECSARLMILGEGEARAELEELVRRLGLEERVALPGFVANPYAYMARAKVFALSSIWEGLPTVLIEALACGCRVVSTDCRSGPREILEDGRWGRLVPVGAVDDLATALLMMLCTTPNAEGSVAMARFTPAASAAQYLRLIEGLGLG